MSVIDFAPSGLKTKLAHYDKKVLTATRASRIRRRLLRWGKEHERRTPWRARRRAYPIALAEILLQKTKSADAEVVWKQLLAAYPTARSLSRASIRRLLRMVSPLGLGSQRAGRLRSMASWLAGRGTPEHSPGLGPYGQAILALSLGRPTEAAPVDGNVARVICRLFGLEFDRGEPRKKPQVADIALTLMGKRRSPRSQLDVVYALVDLGAKVCTPFNPSCVACPLLNACSFANSGSFAARTLRTDVANVRATGGGTASETRRI